MRLSSQETYTLFWIQFSIGLVSLLCSVATLYLIHRMKIKNGYFTIIYSLTVCQFIYDINFLLGVAPGYAPCVAWNVLDIFGGMSFSIWSNFLSYIVLYVVTYIRVFHVQRYYTYFFILAVVCPFILSVLVLVIIIPAHADDDTPYEYCIYNDSDLSTAIGNIYYWGRILTTLVNFFVFFYINRKILKMMQRIRFSQNRNTLPSLASTTQQGSPVNRFLRLFPFYQTYRLEAQLQSVLQEHSLHSSVTHSLYHTQVKQCLAIVALAKRMKYYPLAQAISRLGSAWNEFDGHDYASLTSNSLSCILAPSAGLLNFIIFLIMQPRAWATLVYLLSLGPPPPPPAFSRPISAPVPSPIQSPQTISTDDSDPYRFPTISSLTMSFGPFSLLPAWDDLGEDGLDEVIEGNWKKAGGRGEVD